MKTTFAAAALIAALASRTALAGCNAAESVVLTDAAGDWSGDVAALAGVSGAGTPEQDILQASVAQVEDNLVFKLTLAGAPPLQLLPTAAWYISFENPDGVVYGVRMQTDATGTASFFSYLAGAANGGQVDGRFVDASIPAEGGSGFDGGVVTIVVKPVNLGIEEPLGGQGIGPFNAATVQSVPEGLLAFTQDEMPDGLQRDGYFDLCTGDGKSDADLPVGGAGAPALWIPMALMALLRRRSKQ
ncbi:MAG TPA: hypothetical protein VM369_01880 [Candidatus Binatia bacterium]|nr:hypothetical protein [Candidatus Binatia bacterium]